MENFGLRTKKCVRSVSQRIFKDGTHISKRCINNGFKSLESCEVNIVLTAIAVNEGISISSNGNPLEYLIWTTKFDYIYMQNYHPY